MSEKEFVARELVGLERNFIRVPRDVIRHENDKVILSYIYFATKCGLDNEIEFTLNQLARWYGYKPNTRKGAMNDVFAESVNDLEKLGYVSIDDSTLFAKPSIVITVTFNQAYLDNQIKKFKNDGCFDIFAILYVDEIEKVNQYLKANKGRNSINVGAVYKMFAYLRSAIHIGEKVNAEAYDDYFNIISEYLHLTPKLCSKVCDILSRDLGLIYVRHIRVCTKNGGYVTLSTIFVNTYKRSNGKLLAEGEDYYFGEIDKKKALLYGKYITKSKTGKKKKLNVTIADDERFIDNSPIDSDVINVETVDGEIIDPELAEILNNE